MSNIVWTPIVKGQRKPEGRVLVTHSIPNAEAKLLAAIFGGKTSPPQQISIARWSKKSQRWMTSSSSIENVTAWAPLPAPYGATE